MSDPVTFAVNADELIKLALKEDITSEDASTNAVIRKKTLGRVQLICKQNGVICGLSVFKRTFELLDGSVKIKLFAEDGDRVEKGQLIAEVEGDIRVLLSGERTALNFLQRMSGIATMTRKYARQLEGTHTRVLDTRKTTPGMRILEKMAVKIILAMAMMARFLPRRFWIRSYLRA